MLQTLVEERFALKLRIDVQTIEANTIVKSHNHSLIQINSS